ncbi:MAG: hypothetical protein RLZZ385_625 [Pseudomonadota bacterium]|jgi:hypothetical protein
MSRTLRNATVKSATVNSATVKSATVILLLSMLAGCVTPAGPYKAYEGAEMRPAQLALVTGETYIRRDVLNVYVDRIRFMSVDGRPIENSERFDEIQLAPGYHDVTVYYSWDTGSQRGLAPALVNYAASRESIRRTLRLHAEAGKTYLVKGDAAFITERREIVSLTHVDYWIEDDSGRIVVSREEGKYVASP